MRIYYSLNRMPGCAVAHPTMNWLQKMESNHRLTGYEPGSLTVCPFCNMVGGASNDLASSDFQSATHPSMSPSQMVLLVGFEPAIQG